MCKYYAMGVPYAKDRLSQLNSEGVMQTIYPMSILSPAVKFR